MVNQSPAGSDALSRQPQRCRLSDFQPPQLSNLQPPLTQNRKSPNKLMSSKHARPERAARAGEVTRVSFHRERIDRQRLALGQTALPMDASLIAMVTAIRDEVTTTNRGSFMSLRCKRLLIPQSLLVAAGELPGYRWSPLEDRATAGLWLALALPKTRRLTCLAGQTVCV